jgi:hypothetical protein
VWNAALEFLHRLRSFLDAVAQHESLSPMACTGITVPVKAGTI